MLTPTPRRRALGWGLAASMFCIAFVPTPTPAAGLKRAPRTASQPSSEAVTEATPQATEDGRLRPTTDAPGSQGAPVVTGPTSAAQTTFEDRAPTPSTGGSSATSAPSQAYSAGPRVIIGPRSTGAFAGAAGTATLPADAAVVTIPGQTDSRSQSPLPSGAAGAGPQIPGQSSGDAVLAPTATVNSGGVRLISGTAGAAAQLPPHLGATALPSATALQSAASGALGASVVSATSAPAVSGPPVALAAVGYTTPAVPFPGGQGRPVTVAQAGGQVQAIPFPAPAAPQTPPAPASPPTAFPTGPATQQPVTVPGAQPAVPAIPTQTQWPTVPVQTPGAVTPGAGFPTQSPTPAGIGFPATAAPTAPVAQAIQVTPESAAELAVKNSIDLKITATSIAEAEAQVRKALGLDDLRLTAGLNLVLQPESKMTVGEMSIVTGKSFVESASLSAALPLYTGKAIEHSQELARRGLRATVLSRPVVARALDLAARETVFGVLRAEQLADVAQKQATAVAAHLDLSRKLADGGVVAKFEVVQAETELSRAQGDVISARTAVETAKAALRRVLTLPQDTPIAVAPAMSYDMPTVDRQALIAQALRDRPETAVGEAVVRVAESGVDVAGTANNLNVNLLGSLNHTNAATGGGLNWQIALAFEKALMDGNAQASSVDAAKAQLEAARLDLEKTRHGIALEVTQYHLALDEAAESLKVARQGVVEAEEQLRISKVRYENGIALGVEVLDAETALAAARVQVVNSEYNLQLAIAQLRSAVGWWGGSNESGGQ